MKKILYFDCTYGIAGDMTISALISLGAPKNAFVKSMESLSVRPDSFSFKQVIEGGIKGYKFSLVDKGSHEFRKYKDLNNIIVKAKISDKAKQYSFSILEVLAEAEAKVHGVSKDDLHFHEIGTIDTIVDIVGTSVLIDKLEVDEIWSSPVPSGSGTVKTSHGELPVPAPATLEILKGIKLSKKKLEGEVTTPTGAAILKGLKAGVKPPGDFIVDNIGYGFGHLKKPHPNFLRVMLARIEDETESVIEVRTNIDDETPEIISYAVGKLLSSGVLDAWVAPVTMKKGRPGMIIGFLCHEKDLDRLTDILFENTSTIGVRYHRVNRKIMQRRIENIKTKYGKVKVKVSKKGKNFNINAEYDDCAKLAEKYGLPVSDIKREAEHKCSLKLTSEKKDEPDD